jgi:hypothetical protein
VKSTKLIKYVKNDVQTLVVANLDKLNSDSFYKMKQLVHIKDSQIKIRAGQKSFMCCMKPKPKKYDEIKSYSFKDKHADAYKSYKYFKKNLHSAMNDENILNKFIMLEEIEKSYMEYFQKKVSKIFEDNKLTEKLKNEVDNYWEFFNIRRLIEKQEKIIKSQKKKFSKLEDVQINNDCIICMEATRNVIFNPCLHLICCENCSFSKVGSDCPECHSEIERKQMVYT